MYYTVFIIGVILSIVNDKKKISFKIFGAILLVLAFLRYGVGSDYFSYNFLYNRLSESLLLEFNYGLDNQEILFRIFGSILKKIGFSYQQYLIIIAIINLNFIFKICKKYSKNPTLSLLIYFSFYYFVWTFSGLRQGIVLAIGMYYLLECLENNRTIKLLLISLLLSLVHASGIVLIFLYIGAKINFNKKKLMFLSFVGILFSIIPIDNILLKLTWIPYINRILPYIDSNITILSILDFQSLGRVVFLVIALFYYDLYSRKNDISKLIINIYILSIILYFCLKFSELTAARLSIYGMLLNIIILPNIFYIQKDKFNRFIYITFIGVFCIAYFNKELYTMEKQTGLVNSNKIIIPYTNIYNKEKYIFNKKHFYYLD